MKHDRISGKEFLAMEKVASILLALIVVMLALPTVAVAASKTLDNLQTAYDGESNAHARYLAFAEKADQEQYGEIASLFRAAARAESIHAANHAAVIRQLGGTAEAKIETPSVKSTRENLEAAIKGESYERDAMYPEFLKEARAEKNREAVRTLNLAQMAEAEHARLYTDALNNLERLKNSKAKKYFVCRVCGFTSAKPEFSKCPSCFSHKDKFESVT
ncbi:MAG TPA: rubrerythrin family protein [Candidatus Sulfotelmatobacter sp.]|nr:rubrerythrin family protein [Candidatus Sulfotelmatobacter sp.]